MRFPFNALAAPLEPQPEVAFTTMTRDFASFRHS